MSLAVLPVTYHHYDIAGIVCSLPPLSLSSLPPLSLPPVSLPTLSLPSSLLDVSFGGDGGGSCRVEHAIMSVLEQQLRGLAIVIN